MQVTRCRHAETWWSRGKETGAETERHGRSVADDKKKLRLKREDAHDRAAWRGSILENRPTRASAERRTQKR
jgi:hypothetical protein